MQQGVVGKGNEAFEQSFGAVCNFLKDESRSHQNATGCSVCSWLKGSISRSHTASLDSRRLVKPCAAEFAATSKSKARGGGCFLFLFLKMNTHII